MSGAHVTVTTTEAAGCTLVTFAGELDVYTAPTLGESICGLIREGNGNLVIDLTRVEFLDSTGLGVLVGALKQIQACNGSLQLVCNQERLLKIFRITALIEVFVIRDTVEAALAGR
jgi:anti-sigma B factor antagonist